MSDNWLKMTACDLGRGIGSGDINAVELTECYLDAIDAHDLSPRIYARTTRDRALSEAAAAKARADAGQRLGVLDGVPMSWKDLFDTAGTATEAGSELLKGRTPDSDAEVLTNATLRGAVCLGKTHMSELAFSGLGLNPVTETPPCVNDLEGVSGGSSSGAATSVAFGLAPIGIGSDTGGSVRIPSAWNDLVGLKTTHGRVSVKGVVPLCDTFDTVGPLCRSVEDAAETLAMLEGTRAADLRGTSLKGARFAVLKTMALDEVRDGPAQGFEQSVSKLAAAGATITEIDIPEVTDAMALAPVLFATKAYATWKDTIEANPHLMYEEILERFRGGAGFSGTDYIQAWDQLRLLRQAYLAATAGYDAVLMPTCPILPPNMERLLSDSNYYVTENLLALRNTRIGNLMGLCGLTLPTDIPSSGILLNAAPNSEERLLRVAHAAESALKATA